MVDVPLSTEYLVSGIVGLISFGLIVKRVVDGYLEARKHLSTQTHNPIIQAMANSWDKDQQERFLQLMERLVIAEEHQARHQGALADRQQADIQDKLDQLLEQMELFPAPARK